MNVRPPGEADAPVLAATPALTTPETVTSAARRGWGQLLLALLAFLLLPLIPWTRAILPVDQTAVLVLPALAACAIVGWWAGGRLSLALIWIATAVYVTVWPVATTPGGISEFGNLERGWALLLAGAFGLVSLLGDHRPVFSRALGAVTIALGLGLAMVLIRPGILPQASAVVSEELTRRNGETMQTLHQAIQTYSKEWSEVTAKTPEIAAAPGEIESLLGKLARTGLSVFPALLALESLAALALAWTIYHRLARIRLGPPLAPLRDFRFNDQLVWGLIVGLILVLLPTLRVWSGAGLNLVVFFGVLYGIRGLGVLSWFLAPGALPRMILVAFILLWLPILGDGAALALFAMGIAAVGLGLGDTWADWRGRAAARRAALPR